MNEKNKNTPSDRMAELTAAMELIQAATTEEKQEVFSELFGGLEKYKAALKQPENKMQSHYDIVTDADIELYFSLELLTGYKLGWISDKMAAHTKSSGRNAKYTESGRAINCYFIEQLVTRGSSPRQAMMLLARLKGDFSMSEGLQRELRETYKEYMQLKEGTLEMDQRFMRGHIIAELLGFSIEHLDGPEKASAKAVDAFRSFCQDIISGIKDTHAIVAKHDKSYPEIYGNLIGWITEDYEDPLDYFFTHPSHKTDPLNVRKRWLQTYLNSLDYFRNAHPAPQS